MSTSPMSTSMIRCTSIESLGAALRPAWQGERAVGLVPTMGALHEGHLSLVRRARAENEVLAVSIFVNPTQFGPTEDLERYPRTPERDQALLEAEGVDVVFMPTPAVMYPPGASTRVEVGPLAAILEGALRPGHFAGVATVVTKLFHLTRPRRAYFGQKDAQQLAVIRRFAADLNLPVEIVGCPIVREADGLALSSRNRYLSPAERQAALVLSRALGVAAAAYADGERAAAVLSRLMRWTVEAEPLARLDYAEVVEGLTWETPAVAASGCLLLLAARLGATRLIDNHVLV
jgi:pantoate--beta-alanine ligase